MKKKTADSKKRHANVGAQRPELTEEELSKVVGGSKKSTGSTTTTTIPK